MAPGREPRHPYGHPADSRPAGIDLPAGVDHGEHPAASTENAASKKDAAKDEAAEVKRQATDAAQNVAETAKTEAANVAAEVKTNARDLLHQAKSDLTDQAGTQQQKVAEGLRSDLHRTALHGLRVRSARRGHRPRTPGRRAVLRRCVLARRTGSRVPC